MRHRFLILTISIYSLLSACTTTAQEVTPHSRRARTTAAPRPVSAEGREAAERALARLRSLRDGWNDVNRQFIKQNFVAAQRLDSREYEVQYLEAKTAVGETLQRLPKGELRTAVEQAMDIFDDLEAITNIFRKNSPFTTNVRVTDIFPYLKKYNVPYESGVTHASYGLMLHQDFVMGYILPLRYARVNRVEVLLGGKAKPVPPPPTYEQMFRVPPPPVRPNVGVEELKGIAQRAVEARLRGDRAGMSPLLDDRFVFYRFERTELNKGQYLSQLVADPMVKGFKFEQADLSFRQESPVLTTRIRYESIRGEFRSFKNTFTFVNRNGAWLIGTWRSF